MNTENENLMIQYLLGELTDEEKLRLEEMFFADDNLFDQLQAMEDELRYDYAQGSLTPQQRGRFEQQFMKSPGASQRVNLAKAVLDKVAEIELPPAPAQETASDEKPGFIQSLLSMFSLQMPVMQLAMGAAAILLMFGAAWLLSENMRMRGEFEQLQAQRQSAKQSAEQQIAQQRQQQEQLSSELDAERDKRLQLEKELAEQKAQAAKPQPTTSEAAPSFLALILSPGLSRDIDAIKELRLTPEIDQVRLQLRIRRQGNYKAFRANLVTLDGKQISQLNRVSRLGQNVRMILPATILAAGDYMIRLEGHNTDGEWEEIDDYTFTVLKA